MSLTELSSDVTHRADKALLLSIPDSASYLGVGSQFLRAALKSGKIRGVKIGLHGGKVRIPKTELEAFVQRQLEAEK